MNTRQVASVLLIVAPIALSAQAEPRQQQSSKERKNHNYILSRQQAYHVQGVPTVATDHREERNRYLSERFDV